MTIFHKKNSELSFIVKGYKFEPIVNVAQNTVFAYEMLSILEQNVDSETFFS